MENWLLSYSLNVSAKDKASCRFKSRVNRALVKAVVKAKGTGILPKLKLPTKWVSISLRCPA